MLDDPYASQTEIGELYEVSSHVVGRWLKALGLRTDDGRPSQKAFDEHFVAQRSSRGEGTYFWVWHRERTTELLDREHGRSVE